MTVVTIHCLRHVPTGKETDGIVCQQENECPIAAIPFLRGFHVEPIFLDGSTELILIPKIVWWIAQSVLPMIVLMKIAHGRMISRWSTVAPSICTIWYALQFASLPTATLASRYPDNGSIDKHKKADFVIQSIRSIITL